MPWAIYMKSSKNAKQQNPTLKVNGKPLSTDHTCFPRVIEFLKISPPDQLYTFGEIQRKLGIANSTLALFTPRLTQFRMRLGKAYLYGSLKAIAALRRELEAQRNSSAAE